MVFRSILLALPVVSALQLNAKSAIKLPDILQSFVALSKSEKGFTEVSALDKLGEQYGALSLALSGVKGADDVNGCKSKIPDYHAYANCVLAAISGRMVSVDYSHLSDADKENFCHDAPKIFNKLLDAVEARMETISKRPPPPSTDGSTDDGKPPSKAYAAVQDTIFTENVLTAMNDFCAS